MWTYSTNFMGPAPWWYKENNIPYTLIPLFCETEQKDIDYKHYKQYAGGRIDCYCSDINDQDYSKYNQEVSLPIMEVESFIEFGDWLENFSSPKLLSFEELKKLYEKDTNNKIILFK